MKDQDRMPQNLGKLCDSVQMEFSGTTAPPDIRLVAEASNGREAIQQFRAHWADIPLMDLQMPMMTRLEATAAIRQEFPESKIIILTTYAGDADGAKELLNLA